MAAHTTAVVVPDIGDFKDIPVIEVLVAVGDQIKVEQSLASLESDKATMDVPSSVAGIVRAIHVKPGDLVSQGTLLVDVEANADIGEAIAVPAPIADKLPQRSQTAAEIAPVETRPTTLPVVAPALVTDDAKKAYASPSVRRFARELGVNIGQVVGTGMKGRITQEDVQNFVKLAMTAQRSASGTAQTASGLPGILSWPVVDFEKFGPVTMEPLSRIKKLSGANLHRNWVMIPHVTNCDEADITDLEAFRLQVNKERASEGVKLTMLAFLIKASAFALKQFPVVNASLDADQLVLKQYWHIGFAADTPNGLMVPVIRNADQKGVIEIAQETSMLAKLARDGKLKPDQMQGGTFSISSLGGIGGTYFTPIINAPEVAIMGVCKSTLKPVWDGQQFAPRLILPLSLSWDHRVIDGALAARFNRYLIDLLADFRRVLL